MLNKNIIISILITTILLLVFCLCKKKNIAEYFQNSPKNDTYYNSIVSDVENLLDQQGYQFGGASATNKKNIIDIIDEIAEDGNISNVNSTDILKKYVSKHHPERKQHNHIGSAETEKQQQRMKKYESTGLGYGIDIDADTGPDDQHICNINDATIFMHPKQENEDDAKENTKSSNIDAYSRYTNYINNSTLPDTELKLFIHVPTSYMTIYVLYILPYIKELYGDFCNKISPLIIKDVEEKNINTYIKSLFYLNDNELSKIYELLKDSSSSATALVPSGSTIPAHASGSAIPAHAKGSAIPAHASGSAIPAHATDDTTTIHAPSIDRSSQEDETCPNTKKSQHVQTTVDNTHSDNSKISIGMREIANISQQLSNSSLTSEERKNLENRRSIIMGNYIGEGKIANGIFNRTQLFILIKLEYIRADALHKQNCEKYELRFNNKVNDFKKNDRYSDLIKKINNYTGLDVNGNDYNKFLERDLTLNVPTHREISKTCDNPINNQVYDSVNQKISQFERAIRVLRKDLGDITHKDSWKGDAYNSSKMYGFNQIKTNGYLGQPCGLINHDFAPATLDNSVFSLTQDNIRLSSF